MSAPHQHPMDGQMDGTVGFTGLVLQETYTLGARIGRGGMGEVYEAAHVRLPGRMAVKILRPDLRTHEEAFRRFCREAEIMSAVQHPHIVQIFDFNTAPALDGLPYFVMEYLDGVDLEKRLMDSGPLSVAATVRIVDAVASALAAAHAAGVVHRDLKPANVFLMRGEGQDADFVKLIDFGISKVSRSTLRLSNAPDVIGTPDFMAPEQALGLVGKMDGRTDEFALAAITYTMLTGRAPFEGDDAPSVLYQVVHEPHAPLSRFLSGEATRLQPVLDRALAKRPEDRYETVVEFAQALEAAAGDSNDGPPQPAVAPRPLRQPQYTVDAPPVRRLPSAVEPPPVRMSLAPTVEHLSFSDAELPRSVDRIPRGPQRAVALGLAALGLTAIVAYKGWYHGLAGRVVQAERRVLRFAHEGSQASKPRVGVPVTEAPSVPAAQGAAAPAAALAPTAEEVPSAAPARRPTVRRAPAHGGTQSRSRWQTIQIVSLPPSSAPEDLPAPAISEPQPTPATEPARAFSIPEPAPTPPAGDIAPAAAASE